MPDSRDAVARRRERAHSNRPPYANTLPGVFPYKKTLRRSELTALVWAITQEIQRREEEEVLGADGRFVGADGDGLWFAVSGHPMRTDGAVHLWLSLGCVRYLHGEGIIGEVEES